ncbi:MAG: hypothetical protein WCH46_10725 [bacterium]
MNIFFLLATILVFVTNISVIVASPSRPDIDTVSISNLTPGVDGKLVSTRITATMDTMLWSEDGTGITKFKGSYLGFSGEYRVAYDKGMISQVSFVAPTHNPEEAIKFYDQMSEQLIAYFGPADISSSSSVHELRWEGMKQSYSIKAVDATNYVTVALSRFER